MAWLAHQTHVVTKGHCERCLASSREFAITFACPYTAPRRVLSETEGREVVKAALQLPDVQGLQANSVPADSALLSDARLDQIHHSLTLEFRRVLSEAEWRHVVDAARQLPYVQGLQAEATDLAELTSLRAERDNFLDINRELIQRELPTETRDRNRQIVHLTKELEAAKAARDALHAQLEELKDCVRDWIHEGLIVPDASLKALLASAPSVAQETTG